MFFRGWVQWSGIVTYLRNLAPKKWLVKCSEGCMDGGGAILGPTWVFPVVLMWNIWPGIILPFSWEDLFEEWWDCGGQSISVEWASTGGPRNTTRESVHLLGLGSSWRCMLDMDWVFPCARSLADSTRQGQQVGSLCALPLLPPYTWSRRNLEVAMV